MIKKKKGIKKISFDIPPGVDSGDYTIPNEGNEIPRGINGDLIVRVKHGNKGSIIRY